MSLMREGGFGCKAKQRRKVQREVEKAGEAGERWIGSSAVAILSWIARLGCSLTGRHNFYRLEYCNHLAAKCISCKNVREFCNNFNAS